MTKIEQISQEVATLSDYQLEVALEFIRGMKKPPFFYSAPPEALASIERGREQLARGESIELDELTRRLERAARCDSR